MGTIILIFFLHYYRLLWDDNDDFMGFTREFVGIKPSEKGNNGGVFIRSIIIRSLP